jgi:hypothetical protein
MNQYVSKRFSSQYKATIGADFLTKEVSVLSQERVGEGREVESRERRDRKRWGGSLGQGYSAL